MGLGGDQGPQLHFPGQRRGQGTCLSACLGQAPWAQLWGPLLSFLVAKKQGEVAEDGMEASLRGRVTYFLPTLSPDIWNSISLRVPTSHKPKGITGTITIQPQEGTNGAGPYCIELALGSW